MSFPGSYPVEVWVIKELMHTAMGYLPRKNYDLLKKSVDKMRKENVDNKEKAILILNTMHDYIKWGN